MAEFTYLSLEELSTYFQEHIKRRQFESIEERDRIAYLKDLENYIKTIDLQVPYDDSFNQDILVDDEISINEKIRKLNYYFNHDTDFNTALKNAMCEAFIYRYNNLETIEEAYNMQNAGIKSYSTSKVSENLGSIKEIQLNLGLKSFNILSAYLPFENNIVRLKGYL